MTSIEIEYVGNRPCQDNVVRYRWEPGDVHEIDEDNANRLLTNGSFREAGEDCSSRHSVYSRKGEPCPDCGEDKWVSFEEDDEEEDSPVEVAYTPNDYEDYDYEDDE